MIQLTFQRLCEILAHTCSKHSMCPVGNEICLFSPLQDDEYPTPCHKITAEHWKDLMTLAVVEGLKQSVLTRREN